MRIFAGDLSLNATGYARGVTLGILKPPNTHARGMGRLQWIRDNVLRLASGADLVLLEGYSYGSKGRAVINIAEMGGVVRLALFEAGLTVVELAPPTLKKLATGKGNAGKEMVLAEAIRRLGYEGSSNNESDAMWLREAARQHYDLPEKAQLPKTHVEALSVIDWPEIP